MTTLDRLAAALADRYRLARELGAGGMATVYLAHDLKHDRDVAIKVLHPDLGAALGGDRFLSEIRTTARLQHPHILPLLDSGEADGLLYYVMPLVTGETLRARLERERQLPIADAVRIARDVASALDYAHRQNVIHRDIKPENILLHDGSALVADFGIALAVQSASGARMTQTGLSLGTPQYMSPEQAMGERTIDARSDIYALGAVTYEMLVGDAPFTGSSVQAIVARVLTEKPQAMVTVRDTVPRAVERAVLMALAKLPADRFASAREFADALGQQTDATTATRTPASRTGNGSRTALAAVAVGAALLGAAAVAVMQRMRAPPRPPVAARFALATPPNVVFDNVFAPLAITPDGRTVVFRANVDGRIMLVRRDLDGLDVRPISGTENGGFPAVSPDGRWLAFNSNGRLRKVPIDGGPSIALSGATVNNITTTWAADGMLVATGADSTLRGLYTIASTGGVPRPLTRVDTAQETRHIWPRVLADGNTIVYTSVPREGVEAARLAVTTVATGASQRLDVAGVYAVGVVFGHLLYVSAEGVLMAVPFDLERRAVNGPPIALLEGIDVNLRVGHARVALAESGTLVYLPTAAESRLVVADGRDGVRVLLDAPQRFSAPAWSPDGRRIAVSVRSSQGQTDLWLFDLAAQTLTRLTADGVVGRASWSPDGARLVYASGRNERLAVWSRPVDGSAGATLLFDRDPSAIHPSLSADGRFLVYKSNDPRASVIWWVDLTGDRRPRRLTDSRSGENDPTLSKDGQWIAFSTSASGTSQVVIRPFPEDGPVTQVSADGGFEPLWSPDGRELYYRRAGEVWAATLSLGPNPGVRERRLLFTGSFVAPGQLTSQDYSVAPDGRRFVMLQRPDNGTQLVVITGWIGELERRLRTR